MTVVVENAHVVTMDAARSEHAAGHVVVQGNRLVAVGPGPAPADLGGAADGSSVRRVDGTGCLLTPGLVNTHHHLYQWTTRGHVVDGTLFEWLQALYPVWAGIDEDVVAASATGALGRLARTGCTTTTDHHYVFPRTGGDLLGAEIEAARSVGLRFHPTRGPMDLGESRGGLPPDHVVEDLDAILTATELAVDTHHDPSFDSMLRIGVAPCSPFSVTGDLLTEAADLARRKGVRLHTHLCETLDEADYCREHFGRTPVQYMEDLGWLGPDVWFAHTVHLDDAGLATLAATGTGAAHCPSSNARLGAGIARVPEMRAAGIDVGLGVDGAASNEASSLLEEVRHAALFARARSGPRAMSVREALHLGTLGGAAVLGRQEEIGSLEPGKLADLALWRVDTLAHVDVADPVAALVLGSPPPLELLLVDGRPVVERDRLVGVNEDVVAADVLAARTRLLDRAGGTR